jgi:hypothetical protein
MISLFPFSFSISNPTEETVLPLSYLFGRLEERIVPLPLTSHSSLFASVSCVRTPESAAVSSASALPLCLPRLSLWWMAYSPRLAPSLGRELARRSIMLAAACCLPWRAPPGGATGSDGWEVRQAGSLAGLLASSWMAAERTSRPGDGAAWSSCPVSRG